eukprot:TRINITY_DN72845_c0_g1_i1.p1 TRINITY_DN72845_c0_g1~~TRINITY_DN72845_c0_g1_i1.p1  ORF type:complete len:455 (+),score=59.62 TRINITY_DN72845_c0_g1_i1:77-1441(+)
MAPLDSSVATSPGSVRVSSEKFTSSGTGLNRARRPQSAPAFRDQARERVTCLLEEFTTRYDESVRSMRESAEKKGFERRSLAVVEERRARARLRESLEDALAEPLLVERPLENPRVRAQEALSVAVSSGKLQRLEAAIAQAEAARVPEQRIRRARRALRQQRERRVKAPRALDTKLQACQESATAGLKASLASKKVHDLRSAVVVAEHAGIDPKLTAKARRMLLDEAAREEIAASRAPNATDQRLMRALKEERFVESPWAQEMQRLREQPRDGQYMAACRTKSPASAEGLAELEAALREHADQKAKRKALTDKWLSHTAYQHQLSAMYERLEQRQRPCDVAPLRRSSPARGDDRSTSPQRAQRSPSRSASCSALPTTPALSSAGHMEPGAEPEPDLSFAAIHGAWLRSQRQAGVGGPFVQPPLSTTTGLVDRDAGDLTSERHLTLMQRRQRSLL